MAIYKLKQHQKILRRRILEISHKHGLSHLGSCLSAVDIIDTIYAVKKPEEKFILSNGHAGVALYVVLEDRGLMKDLHKSKHISVHPDRNMKLGIHVSTGSLGQGLPIALGMALANKDHRVFCIISDGECAEGSIWESLRLASDLNLYNLKVVVNANGWGAYDPIELKLLKKRLQAFCHKLHVISGHDQKSLLKKLKLRSKQLEVIFAQTRVEQLPFLVGQDAHYYVMKDEDFALANNLLK